jgi:hypothetical protein
MSNALQSFTCCRKLAKDSENLSCAALDFLRFNALHGLKLFSSKSALDRVARVEIAWGVSP